MKEQIKKLREDAGLTQAGLASRMGYTSQSTVAMWESGERKPPSDKLPQLAEVLKCSIGDLYKQ